MAIIKANEPLGPRPVIIAWYGDPGIGKTSLFNTCKAPLLIDGDRGVSRSTLRKDTLVIGNWDEVLKHEKDGDFKGYSTIGIDTPKAILDDFLMSYVVGKDPKLRVNKLGAYGAIGDEFKLFLNNRRQDQADIAIICHARKDDDTKRMIPDVTGQSLNLILRIADMIGYYTIINGRRMLSFDPTENTFGKNVARIPPIEVPDCTDPAFRTFMAEIFEKVRTAIASLSEEQQEAMKKSALYQEEIQKADTFERLDELYLEVDSLPLHLAIPLKKVIDDRRVSSFTDAITICDTPDMLTEILEKVNVLSDQARIPLKKLIQEKGREKGYIANVNTKRFELPAGQPAGSAAATSPATGGAAAGKKEPEFLATSFDDRCKKLGELGMDIQVDAAVGYGLSFSWDVMSEWTEDQYINACVELNAAKQVFNKNGTPKGRRKPAGAH